MNDRYLFRVWNGKRFLTRKELSNYLRFSPNGSIYVEHGRWITSSTIEQYTGFSAKKSHRGTKPEDLLIFKGDEVKHVREIEVITSGHPSTSDVESDCFLITRTGKVSITPSKGVFFTGTKVVENLLEDIEPIKEKWRGTLTCISEYAEIIGNIHEGSK